MLSETKGMLSFQQAKEIAENWLISYAQRQDHDLVIVEEKIIETPYAWIFPWTSKRCLEPGSMVRIGGNAPLFIDKADGRISTFRTGLTIEGMIDEYESRNKIPKT